MLARTYTLLMTDETRTKHTTTLSDGEVIQLPDTEEGECVKCGQRMLRFGNSGETWAAWRHADSRLRNRMRTWYGPDYDHDATDDPTHPKRWRTPTGF